MYVKLKLGDEAKLFFLLLLLHEKLVKIHSF